MRGSVSVPRATGGHRPDVVNADACRHLWMAVLAEQVRIAASATPPYKVGRAEHEAAYDWFGTRDFRTVCALAGVDDEFVERKVRQIRASRQRVFVQRHSRSWRAPDRAQQMEAGL